MADFSAADLVAAAKARYSERDLRSRMRGAAGALGALKVDVAGTTYTTATLAFTPVDGGAGASGHVTLSGGAASAAALDDPGAGYLQPPTVTVTGDGTDMAISAILLADVQLLAIAFSVISRAQAALQKSDRWPIPGTWPTGSKDAVGTDIGGVPYSQLWPPNLLENALELFKWRTLAGSDQASIQQQRVGTAAEKYFEAIDSGDMPLGVGGATDVGPPLSLAARNRDGTSNVPSVPDRGNMLDSLAGGWWDYS